MDNFDLFEEEVAVNAADAAFEEDEYYDLDEYKVEVANAIEANLETGQLVRKSELREFVSNRGWYRDALIESLVRSKVFFKVNKEFYVYSGNTKRFRAKQGWNGTIDYDFSIVSPDLLSGLREFVLNANFNIDILFEHQDVSGIDYMMGDLSEYVVEGEFMEAVHLLETLGWVDEESHVLDATPSLEEFDLTLMNQGISLDELDV